MNKQTRSLNPGPIQKNKTPLIPFLKGYLEEVFDQEEVVFSVEEVLVMVLPDPEQAYPAPLDEEEEAVLMFLQVSVPCFYREERPLFVQSPPDSIPVPPAPPL